MCTLCVLCHMVYIAMNREQSISKMLPFPLLSMTRILPRTGLIQTNTRTLRHAGI